MDLYYEFVVILNLVYVQYIFYWFIFNALILPNKKFLRLEWCSYSQSKAFLFCFRFLWYFCAPEGAVSLAENKQTIAPTAGPVTLAIYSHALSVE